MTTWRYLEDVGAGAAGGLATDEAMMLPYGRGNSAVTAATLRLYTYRPHCALVGRYQNLEDEIDLAWCETHGVEVGRRPTGGGAILMGPSQLGVALAAPAGAEATPRQLLGRYAEGVIAGLRRLGVEAKFRSKNDLEVAGRKIAGLGLYLDPRGAVLFHGSVLADLDVGLMLRVLRIPGAKLSDKAVARVGERVTTLSRELGRPLAAADVRAAVRDGFAETFGARLEPGGLDDAERSRRRELEASRYGADAWIRQRSPRRDARGTALLKTPDGLLRIYVGTHGEVIKNALITGDFNVLPPAVQRLEAQLKWCRADAGRIRELTAATLDEDGLGVGAETVAGAVWEAARNALELERRGHPRRLEGSCYFPEAAAEGSGEDQRSSGRMPCAPTQTEDRADRLRVGAHGMRPVSGG